VKVSLSKQLEKENIFFSQFQRFSPQWQGSLAEQNSSPHGSQETEKEREPANVGFCSFSLLFHLNPHLLDGTNHIQGCSFSLS
jgi:hypothetical protein